eukprot:67051-Chlamydomonas_euryale.AAC.6
MSTVFAAWLHQQVYGGGDPEPQLAAPSAHYPVPGECSKLQPRHAPPLRLSANGAVTPLRLPSAPARAALHEHGMGIHTYVHPTMLAVSFGATA